MSAWKVVAQLNDLRGEEPCPVAVEGMRVALFNVDGCVYAIEDRCPHNEVARLSDGYVEDGTIECPIHQSRFDIRTGKVLCAPAETDVRCFATRVQGEDIAIDLESSQ